MENGGFSLQQKQKFIVPVHNNIIEAARQLVRGMKELEISYESELPDGTVETLLHMYSLPPEGFTEELQAMISAVWHDGKVQEHYEQLVEWWNKFEDFLLQQPVPTK